MALFTGSPVHGVAQRRKLTLKIPSTRLLKSPCAKLSITALLTLSGTTIIQRWVNSIGQALHEAGKLAEIQVCVQLTACRGMDQLLNLFFRHCLLGNVGPLHHRA